MSKYSELRTYFSRPREARVALLRREMLGSVRTARELVGALAGTGNRRVQPVLPARSDELIEIMVDSSRDLEQAIEMLPEDGAAVVSEDQLRLIRHDLRGKLGTLRGATMMLQKMRPSEGAGDELGTTIAALRAAVEAMRDALDALTDEHERNE